MRRPSRWLARGAIACLAVGLASAEGFGQARPYLFGVGRFTAAWAGRPWSYDQQIWDHQVAIGCTITGTGLAWVDAEPTPGQYNWDAISYADFCVDQILARGMEPTFFVGLTPAWAALRPDLPPHRTPPSEDYIDEFMDFHRFVANRYKGRVKYYFFWNEPNGCSWINDGCSNGNSYPLYTKWLIRCTTALKEADPDCKVVAANLDYHSGVTQGWQYVQGMYNEGGGPYFDIISIHPYDWTGTIHWQALTDTWNTMVAHGDSNKELWISEYGWNGISETDKSSRLTQVLTELKKPEWSFVKQANYLVLNDGAGVEGYGLMTADLVPRASYYAFRDFDKTFPLTVDFEADVTAGEAPLAVQFTDKSSVSGASGWLWDFGDGSTATEHHPQHVYSAEGVFTVKLTVSGVSGPFSAEKEAMVRVGSFPKVAFIGGQLPPTPADLAVIDHLKSLGLFVDAYDDEPANRPSAATLAATHDLIVGSSTLLSGNVAGEFRNQTVPFVFWEASLAINGREAIADGAQAVGGQTALVIPSNTHPILAGVPTGTVTLATSGSDFSFATGTVASGAAVLATGDGDPSRKTLIVVEPGASLLDGGVAAGRRIFLHLYDTTWTTSNATGRQILTNSVSYALGPVTADFAATTPVQGRVPLTVSLQDESTGPVTSWTWDFGDGAGSTLRHPTHTFTEAGTYDVTLTVTGPTGSNAKVRHAYVDVIPNSRTDYDSDGDVDLADFGVFQVCFNGPQRPLPYPGCTALDFDGDLDLDLADFGTFLSCFNGPDRPPASGCPI